MSAALTSEYPINRLLSEIFASAHPDALQKEAFAHFSELGFPGTKQEEWKYTSLGKLLQHNYAALGGAQTSPATSLPFITTGAHVLLFENGRFAGDISALSAQKGLTIDTIARLRKANDSRLAQHLGKYAPHAGESLNALNTALAADGLFIEVAPNVEVEKPVVVYYVVDADVLAIPRSLVLLGENSSLQLHECFVSRGETPSFTNFVSETHTAKDARLTYGKYQLCGAGASLVDYTRHVQEQGSQVQTITISVDGALTRNNLHFVHRGPHCNSLLSGLYLAGKNSLIDNHTLVDHAVPNCYSNELYKGVVGANGQAVFNGKVMVRPDAQKTNAYQRNANILLSDEAVVNTKPQLEIFADDVKCSHGATTGQMDEEALFYLRSRGIGLQQARALLLQAFATEVLEQVKEPAIAGALQKIISERLETL